MVVTSLYLTPSNLQAKTLKHSYRSLALIRASPPAGDPRESFANTFPLASLCPPRDTPLIAFPLSTPQHVMACSQLGSVDGRNGNFVHVRHFCARSPIVVLNMPAGSLYGISCAQVFFYYQMYRKSDPLSIRVLVRPSCAPSSFCKLLITRVFRRRLYGL
jgi:hypothetical protein